MKSFLLGLTALPFLACASSGATPIRPVSGGTPLDKVFIAQEAILEIVAQSKTLDEAAQRVSRYCADNEAPLKDALVEMTQIPPDDAEAFGRETARRGQELQTRYEKRLESKSAWLEDEGLLGATIRCFGQLADDVPNAEDAPQPEDAPQD